MVTGVAAKAACGGIAGVVTLDDVKAIASAHNKGLGGFGKGYLWANKEANRLLQTPEQLAAVKARGFTPQEVTKIRDYYRAVEKTSDGASPSASHRADLMQYYLDNW